MGFEKQNSRNLSVLDHITTNKPRLETVGAEEDKLSITFDINRPLSTLNADHKPISTSGAVTGLKKTMCGSHFRNTSALGFQSA